MKRICISILAATSVTVAHAVVPDTGPDPLFSFVGKVGGASGTAITSRAVITAKHVGGLTFTLGGTNFQAVARVDHPTADISILNFGVDLPGWHTLGSSADLGSSLTLVGYGDTGVLNGAGNGYTILAGGGIRRASTNLLHERAFVTNYGPSMLSYLNVNGDAVLAAGDSGGGFFHNGRLVGVNSFIFTLNQSLPNYGFASLNGGTAYFGSGAIDLTDPGLRDWVIANAVPEPATMAAIGIGLAALLRRRR